MIPVLFKQTVTTAITAFLMGSLFLFSGCQKGTLYHHSKVFEGEAWSMNKVVVFTENLPAAGSMRLHRQLTLRHSNTFPYQNLWIYLKTYTTDSLPSIDSINWTLAMPDGTWLGKGWGSLYTSTYDLPDLVFDEKDSTRWFRVELMQGLRDSLLTGLSDIGLRIYTP